TRIAVDGGGSCKWHLNSIKVSFTLADDNPLVQGKNLIETNYIFDFDDYGFSDGYGTGKAKETSGDLDLKTNFFPMVFINHLFNKTSLKFFGGDTDDEKWSRRYRLHDTKKIAIEPILHLGKVVTLESPKSQSDSMATTYPDGSVEHESKIKPDYEKLLSMK
ncbi:hypothetical protein, partial [Yersinia mollaretii]